MTDEERENRNPKPELGTFDMEAAPEVPLDTLEYGRVYILQSAKTAASMNFMGKRAVIDPVSFDTVMAYHFYGPRAKINVALRPGPDGVLVDAVGTKIKVRLYTGPDA